ncbi:Probable RNA-directed DNA polymerase from transposon X-element [Eumeta japonica]|uniref:Probable RNA-directed DNA polymerase from transposon X-element n=1 Tax=Eumeta variegata TaxID=151549 RepID=A0A4C1TQX9_EUMVA|nr:Probable RNA-directed DNA polymerase from transposon X-element [Eumeta japonica]
MEELCSRWSPHNLTEAQKTDRITRCNATVTILKEGAFNLVWNTVTDVPSSRRPVTEQRKLSSFFYRRQCRPVMMTSPHSVIPGRSDGASGRAALRRRGAAVGTRATPNTTSQSLAPYIKPGKVDYTTGKFNYNSISWCLLIFNGKEACARVLKVPPSPSRERPEAPRGYKDTSRSAAIPPETQHDGGKIRPHTSYRKAEADPSPGTRRVHGTGTTNRDHQAPRAAVHQLISPILDSPDAIETEKGQEIVEEKEDTAAAASATYRTEDGRSPPKREIEKGRSASSRAVLPNRTTATTTTVRRYITTLTTLTTAEAEWETSTPPPLSQIWLKRWKTRELRDLVQLEDAHIILLGEKKLRPEQELRILNFFAYRRDEISARGPAYRGTAVLIRRDIMHEAEQLTDFETIRSIDIRVGSSEQDIRLFAAYRAPGTRMYVQDIHSIFNDQIPTLIIGELNAKHKAWRSHSISKASRLLMENAEHHGYEVLGPDTPTHVPTDMRHRPDVLDIVIGHKDKRPIHVEVVYGTNTQHLHTFVTVRTGTSNSPQATSRQRVDWENFQTSLEALHLRSSFETAADMDAATTASTSRRGDLPLSIKRKIRHKLRLHKRWTRNRYPKLKKELNDLSRNISEAVQDFRGATWEVTIDRAGESAKSLNQLCRQLIKAAVPKSPITDRSGVRRYDVKARAEMIVEHLAEQFILNPPATSPNLQEHYTQNRVEEFMDTAPLPF